jgi:hypothetical protein
MSKETAVEWFYERLKKVIKTPFKKENEMLKNDETIVLNFLYNRLIEKYGENENYDYMIKFREIINSRNIGDKEEYNPEPDQNYTFEDGV